MSCALIIEDNVDLSEIFSQAVREAGFGKVQVVSSTAEESSLPPVINLIVLDMLPMMPALGLLDRIRRKQPDAKLIVIAADSTTGAKFSSEADLVLIKPVGFLELRNLPLLCEIVEE